MSEAFYAERVALFTALLRDLGCSPGRLLDLGCGAGDLVRHFRAAGVDAWGTDLDAKAPNTLPLALEPYRLPFEDASFDAVVSDQVLEHVRDLAPVLAEVRRVLAPGGRSVHILPARWRPLEAHTNVPLAGVIRSYPWLRLWAALGVRNEFQEGLASREVATRNHRYLHEETFYRTRRELSRLGARFVEDLYLAHSPGRARRAWRVAGRIVPRLYGLLVTRVVAL